MGRAGIDFAAKHPTLVRLGTHLGVATSLGWTAYGCYGMYCGIKQRDRSKVVLGALDAAGGLAWFGIEVTATSNPYVLGGYLGLMGAREAYANREAIIGFGKKAAGAARCTAGRCARYASGVARSAQSGLRDLASGLRQGKPLAAPYPQRAAAVWASP